MGLLNIKCGYCGGTWQVYGRDQWRERRARTCPHCGSAVERQTWEDQVLPAFGQMMDANRELLKLHTGYHGVLFQVNYEEDAYWGDTTTEQLQLLAERVGGMEETLANMLLGVPEQVRQEGLLTHCVEVEHEG